MVALIICVVIMTIPKNNIFVVFLCPDLLKLRRSKVSTSYRADFLKLRIVEESMSQVYFPVLPQWGFSKESMG